MHVLLIILIGIMSMYFDYHSIVSFFNTAFIYHDHLDEYPFSAKLKSIVQ